MDKNKDRELAELLRNCGHCFTLKQIFKLWFWGRFKQYKLEKLHYLMKVDGRTFRNSFKIVSELK